MAGGGFVIIGSSARIILGAIGAKMIFVRMPLFADKAAILPSLLLTPTALAGRISSCVSRVLDSKIGAAFIATSIMIERVSPCNLRFPVTVRKR
jgi:hypothetical protein